MGDRPLMTTTSWGFLHNLQTADVCLLSSAIVTALGRGLMIPLWFKNFLRLTSFYYLRLRSFLSYVQEGVFQFGRNSCTTDGNHMTISIDEEKACDKIHHPFMIKAPKGPDVVGTYHNIVNV